LKRCADRKSRVRHAAPHRSGVFSFANLCWLRVSGIGTWLLEGVLQP
jgi:hypothetical protein